MTIQSYVYKQYLDIIKKKQEFQKKRLLEYSLLDEKKYFFTFEQYEDFLINKHFDITKCLIENIKKKEEQDQIKKEQQFIQEEIDFEKIGEETESENDSQDYEYEDYDTDTDSYN